MKHETVLKFWLETTRQVLTNIPNKVAGGYPRDLYFGVEPKDVDFFVRYNKNTVEEVISRLEQLRLPYHDCSKDLDDDNESTYPTPEDEEINLDVHRIARVIKVGEFIDIIFVNHPLGKVTDNFDFNINQFELGFLDEPIYKGNPHGSILQFLDKSTLYENNEEIKQGRTAKMVNKARRYGWTCSQEILDAL